MGSYARPNARGIEYLVASVTVTRFQFLRSSSDQRRQQPIHYHHASRGLFIGLQKVRELFARDRLVDFRVFGQQNQTRRIAASLNRSPKILESMMDAGMVFFSLNQASSQRGGCVHRQPAFMVAAPQVYGLAVR